MIKSIIQNYNLSDWEETSIEYCKLMIIKANGGGNAVLLCDDNEWKVSAAIRYLSLFDIVVKHCINVGEELTLSENNKNYILISTREMDLATVTNIPKNKITRAVCKLRNLLLCKQHKQEKNLENIIKLSFPYWRKRREEVYLYVKNNIERFESLYSLLADQESKDVLIEIVRCSSDNDIYRKQEGIQGFKYFECYEHKEDEIWVNCGSAVGDTILKFLDCGFSFQKIYAFEGSRSEFYGLKKTLSKVDCDKIEFYNEYIGVDSSDENFDNRFINIPVSLINMDIEGAEMGVLRGAKKIIYKWRPVLAICAYHNPSDLLNIPLLITETVANYKLYLRKYRGYEPNALNEYLYYAVPAERVTLK